MLISYDILQSYSDDDLLILKDAASDELFEIQKNPDQCSIDYWSYLFTSCNTILKSRNNG